MYTQTLYASWADMDFNSHMRNTAYLDKAADIRMMFFSENGFPVNEFLRQGFGPAVMKDEIEYFREFHLLDEVEGNFFLAGSSDDGSRVRIVNEFYRKGSLAARVTSVSGWLDLQQRKLICPPPLLLAAIQKLERADDFETLSGSVR